MVMRMNDFGRILLMLGIAVALIGGVLLFLGKTGFKGLPGDISYQSGNLRVYFPIASCIVISIVLTLGMWLWRWFTGK